MHRQGKLRGASLQKIWLFSLPKLRCGQHGAISEAHRATFNTSQLWVGGGGNLAIRLPSVRNRWISPSRKRA